MNAGKMERGKPRQRRTDLVTMMSKPRSISGDDASQLIVECMQWRGVLCQKEIEKET